MTTRRFESISGILNRTTADSSPADPSPAGRPTEQPGQLDTPSVPPSPAASVTKIRPSTSRPPAAAVRPKASAGADGGVRRIAFRLDPALHDALAAAAANTKTSQGQVVLDAIEAAHHAGTLHDLITAETAPPPTEGLFPRLNGRGAAHPTVPVEIRLHARAAAVLDQLVTDTGATSRTQLIAATLQHHLG